MPGKPINRVIGDIEKFCDFPKIDELLTVIDDPFVDL